MRTMQALNTQLEEANERLAGATAQLHHAEAAALADKEKAQQHLAHITVRAQPWRVLGVAWVLTVSC